MLEKLKIIFHRHNFKSYGNFVANDGTRYWVRKCDKCNRLFWQKLN